MTSSSSPRAVPNQRGQGGTEDSIPEHVDEARGCTQPHAQHMKRQGECQQCNESLICSAVQIVAPPTPIVQSQSMVMKPEAAPSHTLSEGHALQGKASGGES